MLGLAAPGLAAGEPGRSGGARRWSSSGRSGVETDEDSLGRRRAAGADRRAGVRAALRGGPRPRAGVLHATARTAPARLPQRHVEPWALTDAVARPLVPRRPRPRPGRRRGCSGCPGSAAPSGARAGRARTRCPTDVDARAMVSRSRRRHGRAHRAAACSPGRGQSLRLRGGSPGDGGRRPSTSPFTDVARLAEQVACRGAGAWSLDPATCATPSGAAAGRRWPRTARRRRRRRRAPAAAGSRSAPAGAPDPAPPAGPTDRLSPAAVHGALPARTARGSRSTRPRRTSASPTDAAGQGPRAAVRLRHARAPARTTSSRPTGRPGGSTSTTPTRSPARCGWAWTRRSRCWSGCARSPRSPGPPTGRRSRRPGQAVGGRRRRRRRPPVRSRRPRSTGRARTRSPASGRRWPAPAAAPALPRAQPRRDDRA